MKIMNGSFKLKEKLMLSYIAIALIPIFTLGYYLTNTISSNSFKQTRELYNTSAQQLNQNIVNMLGTSAAIIDNIIYNKNLISYLNMQSEDDINLYSFFINNVEPLVNNDIYNDNSIIRIYTDNPFIIFSGLFIRDSGAFKKQLALFDGSGSKDRICWNGIVYKNGRKYLSCSALIYDYVYTFKTVGVLELLIDLKSVYSLIEAEAESGRIIFIDDGSENLLVSSIADPDAGSGSGAPDSGVKNLEAGSIVKFRGKDYLLVKNSINSGRLNIKDWTIRYLIPVEDINGNTKNIWLSSFYLSLICLSISVFALLLLSHNITSRIGILIRNMNQVKQGNFKISANIAGNDEIAEMGERFNDMVKELDVLMNEVYEAKLEVKNTEIKKQKAENARKEAQLLALQSQINPHYLFNTMESIRMNLLLKGERETSEIIKLFAESFRILIYQKGDMVSVHEELEFINKYFIVQKYRYEDKINLLIDADSGLMDVEIPKFVLQPLVENAIYHGLELKEGKGCIKVSITKEGQYLHICVKDDGIGMRRQDLEELQDSIENGSIIGSNMALKNISKRLGLLYNGRARFVVQSEAEIGTCVDIYLPGGGTYV